MRACPNCGKENPDEARFCMACATGLQSDSAPREVRKTVTVVFSDVTGSTALGERLDPESLRRVMGRYFEEMRAALERHGGTVEKFIGDAVMAVFGIPTVHEDDALRAVRAASDMRRALGALNEELKNTWGVTLAARIGVNTGEVVSGDPSAGQYLVTGDAVNVAARLEQAAAPGEILLGEQTYRLARDAVRAERLEQGLDLKGKSQPVSAFRLLDVDVAAAGVERRFDSPMVGRERQLGMLLQAFDAAVSDRACHLFTILGAAGVGKSRLVQEFLTRLPEDARVLRGRCLSYGEGITFWPLAVALREAAGLSDDDPADARRGKIASLFSTTEDAQTYVDRLEEIIGAGPASSAPEENFWAVRKLFESVGRSAPVVVVFDDIHWAEPTFLDLIEYLADWTKDVPILIVCPARPDLLDRRQGWGGGKLNATSILLEPLPESDCARLMENLLGAARLPDEVGRRLLDAAEGTPLFVEEMLSMLIDDGLLRRDDGHWVPTGDLTSVRVPPTIHALLGARLDQLQLEERSALECGSVEGTVFHRGAVASLAPPSVGPRLDTCLMALTRRELIRPHHAELSGEDAFRFRHQLIRDAAYDGMPKARRAELHERFASWLEREAGERQSEYEEILGYHLEQAWRYRTELGPAGEAEIALGHRAGAFLAAAGRRAAARGDVPGAANLLERAVALLSGAPRERIEAGLDLVPAMVDFGELRPAMERAEEVLAWARDLGDRKLELRVRIRRADVHGRIDPDGFVAEAESLAPEAIATFEELGDDRGLAEAWNLVAQRLNMSGHPRAMEEAIETAIEYRGRAGDRRGEIEYISWLAATLFWGETPAEDGIRRLGTMLQQVKGHPHTEALTKRTMAGFLAMLGRFEEARLLLQEATATMEELGAKLFGATGGFFSGPLELMAGDPEAAERELRKSCETLAAMGERGWYCSLAGLLAEALYQQDKYEEAYEWTVNAEEAAGKHDLQAMADIRAVRAKVLARRGLLAEAEAMAREAVEIADGTGELDHEGDGYFDLAEVLRLAGRMTEAAEALRRAIEFWDRKGNLVSAAKARAQLAGLDR